MGTIAEQYTDTPGIVPALNATELDNSTPRKVMITTRIWTVGDIERQYGLSRQRIHKAIRLGEIPGPTHKDSSGRVYWTYLPTLHVIRNGSEENFRIDILLERTNTRVR